MKNFWLERKYDMEHNMEHNNYCIACHKTFWMWFHGQGCICSECSEKGVTRENIVPDIGQVFREVEADRSN